MEFSTLHYTHNQHKTQRYKTESLEKNIEYHYALKDDFLK